VVDRRTGTHGLGEAHADLLHFDACGAMVMVQVRDLSATRAALNADP